MWGVLSPTADQVHYQRVWCNDCQLVLLPNFGDQIINARLMGEDLKVGVEVEKGEEDGLFT